MTDQKGFITPTAKIRAAIEKLQIPADRRFKIDAVAEALYQACGGWLARLDSPHNFPAGSVRGIAVLTKFASDADALVSQINAMPKEVFDAVDVAVKELETLRAALAHPSIHGSPLYWRSALLGLPDLAKRLGLFAECAREAAGELEKTNLAPPRGARPKQYALAVTRVTAWAYRELTGTEPTRQMTVKSVNAYAHGSEAGGPFLDFLKAIFAVAQIDASADAQAKVVLVEKNTT